MSSFERKLQYSWYQNGRHDSEPIKKKCFSLFPYKCKLKTWRCVWEDKAPAGLLQNSLFFIFITNLCWAMTKKNRIASLARQNTHVVLQSRQNVSKHWGGIALFPSNLAACSNSKVRWMFEFSYLCRDDCSGQTSHCRLGCVQTSCHFVFQAKSFVSSDYLIYVKQWHVGSHPETKKGTDESELTVHRAS